MAELFENIFINRDDESDYQSRMLGHAPEPITPRVIPPHRCRIERPSNWFDLPSNLLNDDRLDICRQLLENRIREAGRLQADILTARPHFIAPNNTILNISDDDAFKIVKINNEDEAIKHGNHTGWCTGKVGDPHYQRYYNKGHLYVLYRIKSNGNPKPRPSYQLYIGPRGGHEFRKKGNKLVDFDFFVSNLTNHAFRDELKYLYNYSRHLLSNQTEGKKDVF